MKVSIPSIANRAAALVATSVALASLAQGAPELRAEEEAAGGADQGAALRPKAAGAQTLASRATATSNATVYGGFELTSTTLVYFLVRGNSLGSLGVTQAYLDVPRLRIYNAAGVDIVFDNSGRPGFNLCTSTGTSSGPVVDYYLFVRRTPTNPNDACTSRVLSPGAWTFSVTPSIAGVTTSSLTSVPTFGEILFEVTLNP